MTRRALEYGLSVSFVVYSTLLRRLHIKRPRFFPVRPEDLIR